MDSTQRFHSKEEIETYLRRYKMMKDHVTFILQDLNAMLEPKASAVEFGSRVVPKIIKEPVCGRNRRQNLSNREPLYITKVIWVRENMPVSGRGFGHYADPTADKAILLAETKEKLQNDADFRNMVRIVAVIDSVLETLRERQKFGTERQKNDALLKEKVLKERYIENSLSDTGTWVKLQIPERTYYRWKNEVLDMIAENIRFIGSKAAG